MSFIRSFQCVIQLDLRLDKVSTSLLQEEIMGRSLESLYVEIS